MWALLKQARVPRLRPTAQRPSGPNAHLPGSLVGPVLIFHRYRRERWTTMFESIWFNLPFLSFQSLPICICLFTEPDTTHKRGRSFFIFKPQFERENITNNANPFLYCAEICPSVYVQSIYRNSIPKGKSILKRSFPAIRSIKIETGIQPSENWVMSTFSGQKPFTTIIWIIPPYFLTFFKAWLWI